MALIFAAYLFAFTILDLHSRPLQVFPGIVAWYPPDGLSFAFLLAFGMPFLPALAVASLISSFIIFRLDLPLSALFGWAILISLIYGLAAWFLRRRVRIDTQLRNMRDLLWMIASTIIVATILAWVSVFASTTSGAVPQGELFWATFQWWIGETIGVLVLTPALLIHVMPHVKRFAQGDGTSISFRLPSLKVILQALGIIVSIYLAVEVNWPNDFHPYFLIGFPLAWIAVEHGLPGASLGNVLANFGLTLAVRGHQHFELAELGQLQAMMLVITMTSLIIGVIISDNRRSGQSPTPEIERRRKMIAYEWIIVAVLAMAAWVFEHSYNIFRNIAVWEARNQVEGIDETLATILILGLASGVFSLRRWREYQVELRAREKAQAELQALYHELEARVQERTSDLSEANQLLQTEIIERKLAESAHRESENRFRSLFTTSPDAILLIDPYNSETSWPIVDCNQAACQMNGYTREELIGQSVDIINIQEGTNEERAAYLERLKHEGVIRIEAFHRHKDGHIFSVEVSTSLFTFEGRELVLGIDRDITERKLAEEEIEKSERRFRALVNHSMEEVSLVRTDGTLIFESPTSRRPLGYPTGSFIGRNLFELLHPDDLAAAAKLLEQVTEEPGSYREAAFRLKHMNGSWRWMEGAVTNLLDEPAVRAIVINYRDITEGKEAELALRDSEERFRKLFATSPDALFLIDPNDADVLWPILDCNDSACRMNGYSREEMIGQSIGLLNITPATFEEYATGMEELRREKVVHREAFHRHKDGHVFPIEYSTSLFNYGGRELVLGIDRDITERKKSEEQIQSRNHELSTLYELSRTLAEANDLDQLLNLINRRTVESVHATFARIALLEEDEFVIRSAYPIRFLDRDLQINRRIPITSMPYSQSVLKQDDPIILRTSNLEVSDEERSALLLDFVQTICLIPLRVYEFASNSPNILGLLMLGEARQDEREPFTLEKLRLLRGIGDQAAIAIDNTRLFNDLQRSNTNLTLAYDATIAGWSAALDLRDKETEGHTQRVTAMTLELAESMGITGLDLVHARRGALLHDIGKMGIPDHILLKPDKLTDEEWRQMRMHPTYARDLLSRIDYLQEALDIPYCHHEKWDGTGYPRGLKGGEIPLCARIFAIVDVWDAVTSDRPYRAAWSREKAVDHVRSLGGSHFEPKVVDAFLKMMGEGSV